MIDVDGTVISPGDFLPHAGRFGYLTAIDRYVTGEAIRLLAEDDDLTLEVNLSGTSICDPDLPDFVESQLADAGVPGHRLIFEFTETVALENLDVAHQLSRRLAALDCRVAIDDFGSGFAGFGFVRNIPFDFLKIDGDFVRDVTVNATDRLVIEALVALAKGMGKRTIAEFVWNAETRAEVARLGVDLAQGYHLSPPVDPAVLTCSGAIATPS